MKELEGKRVAFTGKLASMTRAEAVGLVRARGGTYVLSVSQGTSVLVIGQDGWPLRKDGTLTHNLDAAKRLNATGAEIEILTEEELLGRLHLAHDGDAVRGQFSLAQVSHILGMHSERLRSWMRNGWLRPVNTVDGVYYFDFQQITGVRTLCELVRSGVSTSQIRKSLEQLTRWLPGVNTGLDQLKLLDSDGRLLFRLDSGELLEPSGQLHFDFEGETQQLVLETSPKALTAEGLWERGCELEETGRLQEAASAYREALYLGGPNATICFNLGNVLFALGQFSPAVERFWQAVELEHDFAEAWNNLANALFELGETADAISGYQRALATQPDYADAHYNLADALEVTQGHREARKHWKEYLRLEPVGEWAEHARHRLASWRGCA